MSEFPRVRVAGPPRERGRQYGEATRDRVRLSVDAYRDVFAAYAGWDWAKVTEEALRYVAPVKAFGARYVEEMRGLAEGAAEHEAAAIGIIDGLARTLADRRLSRRYLAGARAALDG